MTMDFNLNQDPPEGSPTKFRSWFGKFKVVYQINDMKPEDLEKAPDTKPDPPMVNRMIPLPVHDEDRVLIVKEEDTRNSMADGGVVNPAFEAVDKLQVSGNAWSDTSSENNKDDTLSSRRTENHANDYTDLTMKRAPGATHRRTESKDLKMPPTENDKTSTIKSWDVFRVVPRGKEKAADDEYYNVFRKIVKVIVGIFLTVIILLSTMFSKSALLLITSNVYNNITLQCERLNDKEGTKCVRVPPDQPITNKYIFSQEVVVRWLWALLMVVCTPYLFTFIKCFWRMCFKKTRKPTIKVLLLVVMVETMHTAGMCIFSFYVLPSMDPIRGLMLTFGIGLLPSILKMFDKQSEDGKKWYIVMLDTMAVLAQLSVLLLWPVRNIIRKENYEEAWTIPVSIILISIGWWENYVNRFTGLGAFGTKLKEFKHNVRRMRTKLYVVASLWKVVLTIALMSILMSGGKITCLRVLYYIDSSARDCPHLVHNSVSHDRVWSTSYYADPFWIALIQIFSCLLCYQCAKTACKIMLQIVSFSLPLMLAAPIMAGLFIEDCEAWKTTKSKSGLMPEYLYWTCDIYGVSRGFLDTLITEYYIPVCIAWWLSFMWVTFHIWLPRVERLVQTERLFVQPLYCGVMLEQSLILNRRRDDKDRENRSSEKRKQFSGQDYLNGPYPPELPLTSRANVRREETPMIYVCATMWHETEKEMLQILTSLFRLDNDQCARRNAQRFFDVVDPDYYEFEAHVFFDDAFEAHDDDEYEYHVNSFVKQLVLVMDKAASKVHRVPVRIAPPTKYPTPYGGRLEWSLLGGNKLVAHLKDKAKIRHKKRWSQVMYMYYLLGHKLVSQPLDARRKQVLADNTFVLALDGDVDFKPSAVQLLVDRMKKNEKVGAACGRIHPIGMGPMIWYQKFEYAVSHWLQKSTEHMIGCVLCSPGCFSLFRASALMDDNVMGKYASVSTNARHYVQYDQGEDRWLCTLLLQQGYRVEYCAAADALTYAPEGFREFYNQRRRWSPSTMANIMDLLADWRNIIKINENFSFLYIVYQLLLFASSLVTPATIFLLITGSINAAFPALDLIDSLIINTVPVGIFLAACFFLSSEWQLRIAGVLTLVYALVMMIVVVELILQLILEGLCSPTAIFMIFLVSVFVISAILHPQEFHCILHGALYFLAVPSMSMLLMMYSICNMHIVSWGTRETATAVPANTANQVKKTSTSKIQSILNRLSNNHDELDSDYGFSFGNLFKCLCCPRPRVDSNEKKFELVLQKLETIEKAIASGDEQEDVPENKTMKDEETNVNCDNFLDKESSMSNSDLPTEDSGIKYNPVFKTTIDPNEEDLSPYWIQDSDVGKGRIRYISKEEKTFWRDLIDKYLFPLENNEAQKKKMQENLIELRNKMSLIFFMINGLFIVIIFTLQYTNGIYQGRGVSIPLPCRVRNGKHLTIEPLSFTFMAVFGIALVIQFISMFFHRLGTFLHIVASTEVNCMKPNQGEITAMDIASKVQLVREMQSFEDDDDTRSVSTVTSDFDEDSSLTQDDSPKMKKRKTVIRITKRKRKPVEQRGTLGTKFMKSFMELANDLRNERHPSESSDKNKKERDSDKKRSRKATRALGSIQQEKDIVLSKADAIEVKWRKLAARARGDQTHSHSKVDSWLGLVKDVLHQSRTSLNVIGEEEKKSSLPWKRGGASRSNSIELPTEDLHNLRHLPQRSSYAGVSSLNIISDEDEPTLEPPLAPSAIVNNVEGPGATDEFHTYETVVMEPRPKRDRIVSDENSPEARSIESDSDLSESPVTSMKENKYVELTETNTSSSVRFAQPTTVTSL